MTNESDPIEIPEGHTWHDEIPILLRNVGPFILTNFLQWSFTAAGVIAVGQLGHTELAAIALGQMTFNITGWVVNLGFASALDTLCAQAYGSGKKKSVGLHFQRIVWLLWGLNVPIAVLWWFSEQILGAILKDEADSIQLTALYLKVLVCGLPGLSVFEGGKRFMLAQGLFIPTLNFLLVFAPFNAALHWLLIWKFELGFIGAPISVAITYTLLGISLIASITVFGLGKQCWRLPTIREMFTGYGPVLRLAVPSVVVMVSEYIAFEILALWAGLLGEDYLAAQGVLVTLATIPGNIPYSITVSIRLGHLIGAGDVKRAQHAAIVAIIGSFTVALCLGSIYLAIRPFLSQVFGLHGESKDIAASMIPFIVVFQFIDSPQICCQGLLRGIGSQWITGWVGLIFLNGVNS